MNAESPPAWAKGQPLDFLREGAKLFKEELGPHCHGAFGLPKERDIAAALEADEAIWTRDRCLAGEPIAAMALLRKLSGPSAHQDFAGRIARPQRGDLIIRALAGSKKGKLRLMDRLSQVFPIIWVEGHVENSELVAFLENLGFRLALVKVAASSDLKGLWLRAEFFNARQLRLPPQLDPADLPALAILQEEFISEDERISILGEAECAAAWADHYSSYNKRHSWSAFALRGFDCLDPSFIEKPAEMSKAWKLANQERLAASCRDTGAAAHFPIALEICDRLPGAKQRIRLMRLAPKGGELTRHADITDPEAGTGIGKLCRLHIPLLTSPECRFLGWELDGRQREMHFPARSLCYLDTRKPHAARNDGEAERIHLVVDTFASDALRDLISIRAAS